MCFCVLLYFTACMLCYCNMVGWAWWDCGLIWWLTILLQCFDTVGWVTWPVKISSPNDLYCVEWDVKPYSTQLVSQRHILGCASGGYDPWIWTLLRFLSNAPPPKFHHPVFTRSAKLSCSWTNKNAAKNINTLRYDTTFSSRNMAYICIVQSYCYKYFNIDISTFVYIWSNWGRCFQMLWYHHRYSSGAGDKWWFIISFSSWLATPVPCNKQSGSLWLHTVSRFVIDYKSVSFYSSLRCHGCQWEMSVRFVYAVCSFYLRLDWLHMSCAVH